MAGRGKEGKQRVAEAEEEEREEEAAAAGNAIHLDVLDAVVSRVSPLDLLSASRVSREWHAAVLSSVRRSPRLPPPWLVLHLPGSRDPAATHAFDPLSRSWCSIPRAPPRYHFHGRPHPPQVSACVRSERGGARLYALSPSALAIATDPFGTAWRQMEAPRYWRTDPVVAAVGTLVVVVGGTSQLEDDASSVEMWDSCGDGGWEACEPMPEAFRWSASISAAASEKRLYVLEKKAPWSASWLDPEAKRWGPTRRVRIPDVTVRHAAIGFVNGRLLVVGAGGAGTGLDWRAESVRLWAVDEETLEVDEEEVGEMPREMVAGLVEEGGWGLRSLGFASEGGYAYVYNPLYLEEFILCELEDRGGGCRWERVPRPSCLEQRPMNKVVFVCCEVGLEDLKMTSN